MRHKGLVTMTLFVFSLFVRSRLSAARHLLVHDGENEAVTSNNSSTDVMSNLTNSSLTGLVTNEVDVGNTLEINSTEQVYNVNNASSMSNSTVKVVEIVQSVTRKTNDEMENFPPEPKKELPMAMIIAGPAAAVSIFLFLVIAYYFHNLQLNKKVKRLSITLYVTPDPSTESSNCDSNNIQARPHKLVPAPSPSPVPFGSRSHSRDSTDIFSNGGARRKSIMPPPTLGVPNMGKRGSNWSAMADQEILNLSAPRRHSTFILWHSKNISNYIFCFIIYTSTNCLD